MHKAYLTITVSDTTSDTVLDILKEHEERDFGIVEVHAKGDIAITEKNLDRLPNKVWIHEPVLSMTNIKSFRLANSEHDARGPNVTTEELAVMMQYGVCTAASIIYTGVPQPYLFDHLALQANITAYGFDVAAIEQFNVDVTEVAVELFEEGTEARWLQIAMPAWFKP